MMDFALTLTFECPHCHLVTDEDIDLADKQGEEIFVCPEKFGGCGKAYWLAWKASAEARVGKVDDFRPGKRVTLDDAPPNSSDPLAAIG